MGRTEKRPFARDADLRRAVTEWAMQGFAVKVKTDGELIILPAGAAPQTADQFDLLDFKR